MKDWEKRFDDSFEYIGIVLDWYMMNVYSEKRKPGSEHLKKIKHFLATALEEQRAKVLSEVKLEFEKWFCPNYLGNMDFEIDEVEDDDLIVHRDTGLEFVAKLNQLKEESKQTNHG